MDNSNWTHGKGNRVSTRIIKAYNRVQCWGGEKRVPNNLGSSRGTTDQSSSIFYTIDHQHELPRFGNTYLPSDRIRTNGGQYKLTRWGCAWPNNGSTGRTILRETYGGTWGNGGCIIARHEGIKFHECFQKWPCTTQRLPFSTVPEIKTRS